MHKIQRCTPLNLENECEYSFPYIENIHKLTVIDYQNPHAVTVSVRLPIWLAWFLNTRATDGSEQSITQTAHFSCLSQLAPLHWPPHLPPCMLLLCSLLSPLFILFLPPFSLNDTEYSIYKHSKK